MRGLSPTSSAPNAKSPSQPALFAFLFAAAWVHEGVGPVAEEAALRDLLLRELLTQHALHGVAPEATMDW